jgi:hypothetical protein
MLLRQKRSKAIVLLQKHFATARADRMPTGHIHNARGMHAQRATLKRKAHACLLHARTGFADAQGLLIPGQASM